MLIVAYIFVEADAKENIGVRRINNKKKLGAMSMGTEDPCLHYQLLIQVFQPKQKVYPLDHPLLGPY